MGHGDEIVIADANFPATSTASRCLQPDVLHFPALDAPQMAEVITDLMPLDAFF